VIDILAAIALCAPAGRSLINPSEYALRRMAASISTIDVLYQVINGPKPSGEYQCDRLFQSTRSMSIHQHEVLTSAPSVYRLFDIVLLPAEVKK
jgi:hypothetical protein